MTNNLKEKVYKIYYEKLITRTFPLPENVMF